MAPNAARILFPTNPDLADILGDTDFDIENLYFFELVGSHNSRLLDFQILGSWNQVPGYGRLWLRRGGEASVATPRRFLDGTPGPQNKGDPRNEATLCKSGVSMSVIYPHHLD